MSIFKNLVKAGIAVDDDNVNGNPPGALGKKISDAAVAAIMKGIGTAEWKSYMSLYASNKEQLERLTVEKATDLPYFSLQRAYIVSNAVCDIGTNGHTANRVNASFDQGLPEAPDGTVAPERPFSIPGIDG